MNLSASECSSGCESGWTTYLDEPTNSTDTRIWASVKICEGKGGYESGDQEDEDLSMVSDASSGPPHLREYENCAFDPRFCGYASPSASEDKRKSKQKSKTKEPRAKKQQSLCLEDTASSPIFHFPQDNLFPPNNHNSVEHISGFSQVLSAAQHGIVQDESMSKKQTGLFKASTKGKKSGSLLGRERQ